MTYNIHGCIGRGGHYDAERILNVLRDVDADLVALQEVYDEEPEDRQFLKGLESLSYAHIIYGVTMQHEHRGAYGNVFLSKWPLAKVEKIDLSISSREPRGAIRVQVDHPTGILDITATHLGLKKTERALQLSKLLAHWEGAMDNANTQRVFCLMGDLNEWFPEWGILAALRRSLGTTPYIPTFPASRPILALDRIFVRPCQVLQRCFAPRTELARRASDHLPLVADLQLVEATG